MSITIGIKWTHAHIIYPLSTSFIHVWHGINSYWMIFKTEDSNEPHTGLRDLNYGGFMIKLLESYKKKITLKCNNQKSGICLWYTLS